MRRYLPTLETAAAKHLDVWATKGEVEIYDAAKRFTFDAASELLLGREAGSDSEELAALFKTYTLGMSGINPILGLDLPFSAFGRALEARTRLLAFVVDSLRRRREGGSGVDALGLLLEARDEHGDNLSDDELAAQALFLLFAGHESTTSQITLALWELCRHPDVLDAAIAEQAAIGTGPLSLEMVEEMGLLDRILLETERLYPPFPGGFRHVLTSFEFGGYRVSKGWQVFYAITGTHHLEALYKSSRTFDPSRFAGAGVPADARRHCSLAGFGGGAHVCLGKDFARLELKVLLALLLREFEVQIPADQDLALVFIPSIRPRNGLKLRLRRRNGGSR
jgi:cytochrome P450